MRIKRLALAAAIACTAPALALAANGPKSAPILSFASIQGLVLPSARPGFSIPGLAAPGAAPDARSWVPDLAALKLPLPPSLSVVNFTAVRNPVPGVAGAASPQLSAMSEPSQPQQAAQLSSLSSRFYDGSGAHAALDVVFEPPTSPGRPPQDPPGGDKGRDDSDGRRLALSFQTAAVPGLMAIEPEKSIYGQMKRVRDFPASREYWSQFKKGAEIDVQSKGQSVFGRPTTITQAATKKIGKLQREDFAGTVPAHQLRAPIRELRRHLLDQLEESRKVWNPNDAPVTLDTSVRVIKFKSFIELYRETHGPGSSPEPEAPAARAPLQVKPEGALAPLSMFLPRAVFLDVDLLDKPIDSQVLSDIMKLQRTGVYFVAFSRKPYASPGSIRDRLIRKMSSYQLSILMPIRFLAVTDNGAVISEFPKGGSVVPVDVAAFTDTEMGMLRASAQKAAETSGLSPKSLRELGQPAVKEAVDEFPGLTRRAAAKLRDPQIRFELLIPRSVKQAQLDAWLAAFDSLLKGYGLEAKAVLSTRVGGQRVLSVQKTDFAQSLPRVLSALGDKFGLYLNANDILVLSEDPDLRRANPHMDFAQLSGLKGEALLENALGLMLGEHRENLEGDLSGSASRMAQFTRDRTRYLSEFLIKQDGAEQNINFFSGHVVHSAMDWLVWNLQNGRRPTEAEFAANLDERWQGGIREFKPVGLPEGESMDGWLRESRRRGLSMYRMVMKIHDRGEILIGTEIPNFFVVKDYKRRVGDVKRRYILHTIFDFVALRPDPNRPGHASIVIYDFKSGPAQSRQKLEKDLQVLTYAFFANQRWVGRPFRSPYLSGSGIYHIDEARVEFIYNAIKQPTTIVAWDLDMIRRKIISTLNRIHVGEQQMLGLTAPRKKKAAPASAKTPKKN